MESCLSMRLLRSDTSDLNKGVPGLISLARWCREWCALQSPRNGWGCSIFRNGFPARYRFDSTAQGSVFSLWAASLMCLTATLLRIRDKLSRSHRFAAGCLNNGLPALELPQSQNMRNVMARVPREVAEDPAERRFLPFGVTKAALEVII